MRLEHDNALEFVFFELRSVGDREIRNFAERRKFRGLPESPSKENKLICRALWLEINCFLALFARSLFAIFFLRLYTNQKNFLSVFFTE